jgi:hypothetical protein
LKGITMPQLKNNYVSYNTRLDRIPFFDEKSKQYPIRRLVQQEEPISKSWSLNTYLDQGVEGACVGFGFSHELAATPQPVKGLTKDSARNLYQQAQKLDEWPGEDYEGTSVLAGAKAVSALGYYTGYAWGFTELDVALAVAYKGPVVIGVNWYEMMFEPNADGYILPGGQWMGGHCTLLKAIDVEKGFYTVHNSWGKSWGLGGTARLSRVDLAKLLREDGEACLPLRTSKVSTLFKE